MPMTLNMPTELMEQDRAERAIAALETNEDTAHVFIDDPMSAISLAQAVYNFLYHPDEFTLRQLAGHFEDLVTDIEGLVTDEDDDGEEENDNEER
jgi:hypothetical protein